MYEVWAYFLQISPFITKTVRFRPMLTVEVTGGRSIRAIVPMTSSDLKGRDAKDPSFLDDLIMHQSFDLERPNLADNTGR